MTKSQAFDKLKKYCAYQDRCHSEVRTKLLSYQVYGDTLDEVIAMLIQEDYLNEERYACSYVRGKYRIKKWGRNKIIQGLKLKRVSAYCINKGLKEIDEELYIENLRQVLTKYIELRKSRYSHHQLRQKALNMAMSKGYNFNLIENILQSLLPK